VSPGKGLLAIDESTGTCNKRFALLDIPQTEPYRRLYRELIITTPSLGEYISGVILYDETIRQATSDGATFIEVIQNASIIPGIKVDTGAKDLAAHPMEKVTEGLDGLRLRLTDYYKMGARFAKWRAVFVIGDDIPSAGCLASNAQALARYAALCQECGLVPVIEPEVLMTGNHSMQRCFAVTREVLHIVFEQLYEQRVRLDCMLLKTNMVLAGLDYPEQPALEEVADATIECLLESVPAIVPGILFLSGGQSCELASARLNLMNLKAGGTRPWTVSFSYARAIQQPALDLWRGKEENVKLAQRVLRHRALCNSAATLGRYDALMEGVPA
jgi:fructose-bisphosphate aldolase class I